MTINIQNKLTNGGITKLSEALVSSVPINITKWEISSTAAIVLNPALTSTPSPLVDSGTTAELSFDLVSANQVIIRLILDESMGPYDIGTIGLYSDDNTLIVLSTLSETIPKQPNAVGVVGNRYTLSIPITFTNVGDAINFSILGSLFASWPYVQTIADLPDANLAPFEGYIIREEPTQARPITAIRNEYPTNSGSFIWTFDYHNSITADDNVESDTYVIDINTKDHIWSSNSTEKMRLKYNTGDVGIGVSNPLAKLDVNGSGRFGDGSVGYITLDTSGHRLGFSRAGVSHINATNAAGFLGFGTGGVDQQMTILANGDVGIGVTPSFKLDVNGSLRLSTGNIMRPDGAGVVAGFGNTASGINADTFSLNNASGTTTHFIKDTSGNIGILTNTPLGNIHIKSGASNLTVPHISGDELIIEGAGHTGITISTTSAFNGHLYFSDLANQNTEVGLIRYNHTAGEFDFWTEGTVACAINNTQQFIVKTGTAISPGLAFNDSGSYVTGLFSPAEDVLCISTNSAERIRVNSNGTVGIAVTSAPLSQLQIGTGSGVTSLNTSANGFSIDGSGNVGMTFSSPNTAAGHISFADPQNSLAGLVRYIHSNDSMDFSTNGTVACIINNTQQLLVKNGTAASPGLSFLNEIATDTGLFSPSDGVLAFTSNGVETGRFLAGGRLQLAGEGSATLPGVYFDSENNTGIYFDGLLGSIAISDSGTEVAAFRGTSGVRFLQGISVNVSGNATQHIRGIYTGVFNSAGTQLLGPIGFSVTKNSDTQYTITHNLSSTNYTIILTPNTIGGDDFWIDQRNANTTVIRVTDSSGNTIAGGVGFDYTIMRL